MARTLGECNIEINMEFFLVFSGINHDFAGLLELEELENRLCKQPADDSN
jgi:hypothetical protein